MDYYGPPGTWVKFNVDPVQTNYLAKVWAVQPTCRDGASAGGWTVFVDLYTNGTWEGWVSYGHLDEVQVTPGNWIGDGQNLGKLKRWPHSYTCYDVWNDEGVHTHMEEYNQYRFACYIPWNDDEYYLWYPATLGWVGRTVYLSVQQPCWQ